PREFRRTRADQKSAAATLGHVADDLDIAERSAGHIAHPDGAAGAGDIARKNPALERQRTITQKKRPAALDSTLIGPVARESNVGQRRRTVLGEDAAAGF